MLLQLALTYSGGAPQPVGDKFGAHLVSLYVDGVLNNQFVVNLNIAKPTGAAALVTVGQYVSTSGTASGGCPGLTISTLR